MTKTSTTKSAGNKHSSKQLKLKKTIKSTSENKDSDILSLLSTEITGIESPQEVKSIEDMEEAIDYLFNIINLLPGNVYWTSREHRFLGCNEELLRSHELKQYSDYIGKTYEDIYDKEIVEDIRAINEEVMQKDKPKILEEDGIKNGKYFATYLTHKVPLHDKHGEVIGLLGISLDITDKKKMEQKIQEAKVQARLQNEKIQAMKSIAASIAHELRTPLRSISNNAGGKKYLDHLLQTYEQAKQAGLPIEEIRPSTLTGLAQTMEGIRRETKYANSFIDMLLTNIKELDSEHEVGTHEVHSIADCINEALRRFPFTPSFQAKLVEWNNNEDFTFRGEPLLIIHILFNLLKNALYFIDKAGKGTIIIELKNDSKYNQLIFRDTGTGIPAKALPHIFDHFYTTSHNGTGIGLTFCKMTMQNVGGNITCCSVEGKFTEFTLNFPLTKS